MGAMVYRACVALRELGERKKLDPVIALGKAAMNVACLVIRVGGAKRVR